MDLAQEIAETIEGVTSFLGNGIPQGSLEVIDRGLPHTPQSLKPGTMGVYTFCYNGRFLKIGKAGPSSNARFLSHHYNPKAASSNLASSILSDADMQDKGITEANVGDWIKQNCRRIDILINADLGIFTLELIEAVLHYKYEPKYEGYQSQR